MDILQDVLCVNDLNNNITPAVQSFCSQVWYTLLHNLVTSHVMFPLITLTYQYHTFALCYCGGLTTLQNMCVSYVNCASRICQSVSICNLCVIMLYGGLSVCLHSMQSCEYIKCNLSVCGCPSSLRLCLYNNRTQALWLHSCAQAVRHGALTVTIQV